MNSRFLYGPTRLVRDRKGFVFVFFAIALVVLIGLAGLAVDSARGYVNKAQVSKAVDAAALAGAKNVRAGADAATSVARAISGANGIEPDGTESLTVEVSPPNDDGEVEVFVRASRKLDTTFMRVLGYDEMNVSSEAEATVPPFDIVLILDQSGSMKKAGAWGPLQDAAKGFVDKFSDEIDQLGVVHFQTMAAVAVPLQKNFTTKAKNRIDKMDPSGDTNSEEALTKAYGELTGPDAREKAMKVVVFFTDGRPTAFRHEAGEGMDGEDGILSVESTNKYDRILGWFTGPDQAPTSLDPDNPWEIANECDRVPSCDAGKTKKGKMDADGRGYDWTEAEVRTTAREEALEMAESIRSSEIVIYSIGLGNMADPDLAPDQAFLQQIANSEGTGSGTQGGFFFAEDKGDLDPVFEAVAADILARLSQ